MPHSAEHLPPAFRRLAWSNLSAQLSEQLALAAAPLVAVLALGALLAAHYGTTACLIAMAAGFFIQSAVLVQSPVRSLRSQPPLKSPCARGC